MGHQAADALRPQHPLLAERMPGRAENSQSSSCLLVAPGGNFDVRGSAPSMLKLQISYIPYTLICGLKYSFSFCILWFGISSLEFDK